MDKNLFGIRPAAPDDMISSELCLKWRSLDDTYTITYSDNPIGIISFYYHDGYNGTYIEQMEIYNKCKNQGYGTYFIKAITESDAESLDVYVLPGNKDALRFWERLGFIKEYDGVSNFVWHLQKDENKFLKE